MKFKTLLISCLCLLSACKSERDKIMELNDFIISEENKAYQIYYSTDSIELAKATLTELIAKAEQVEESGANASPILWIAYYRLAEIHRIKKETKKEGECIEEAFRHLDMVGDSFKPDEVEHTKYATFLLNEIDSHNTIPRWKEDKTNTLF